MSEPEIPTGLRNRYAAIHTQIMDGPEAQLQSWIDNGFAWMTEGHVGRTAMDAQIDGACVAAPEPVTGYWGVEMPAYWQLIDEPGSPGSVANAEAYQAINEE
jgi:hypothetical protein